MSKSSDKSSAGGSYPYPSVLSHLVFLLRRPCSMRIEGGVRVTRRRIISPALAVFGGFGVDAVLVLRVFPRVFEACRLRERPGYGTCGQLR